MKRILLNCLAVLFLLGGMNSALAGTQGQYPMYSGSKKVAILMLKWQDAACPGTRQQVVDRMWNDPKSAHNYFKDMSRGAFEFALPAGAVGGIVPATTSDVYGPYELSIAAGFDKDVTTANADGYYTTGDQVGLTHAVARDLAAAKDGFDAANYDYIMYITPKSSSTGTLRGYAPINGNWSHIFEVTNRTINHEFGHNLSLHHSNTGVDVDNYASYDCVMANDYVPHLDGPHTYQMGWYPDASFGIRGFGQHDIENLAQPDTDNLKVLRFDQGAYRAAIKPDYDLWVDYRVRGIGHDNDLKTTWDRNLVIHYCRPRSKRPGDVQWTHFDNEVSKFMTRGSYTGSENLCTIRFVRENPANGSATVQFIDPNGNQPPVIPSGQYYLIGTGTNAFVVPASDPENDSLTYSIASGPSAGELTNVGNNFTYTGSIVGTYSFTVRVNDGQYDSFDEVITFRVVGGTPPVANAGPDQVADPAVTPHGWEYSSWTGDADSGIMSHYAYTAAHSFGNNHGGSVSVNGVVFTESFSASGTGWSNGGGGRNFDGDDNANITGGSENLAEESVYDAYPLRTVTFSGLTAGKSYTATFYSVGSAASTGSRTLKELDENSVPVSSIVINQNLYGDNNGIKISCGYVAKGTTQTFEISAVKTQTFNLYAMTNRESGTIIATANLGGVVSDVDGDVLATMWSMVSGPSPVVFANPLVSNTIASFTAAGSYVLRLTTSDSMITVTDDVTITVNPAPVTYTVAYDRNNSDGGSVPVDGNSYSSGDLVTVLGNTGSLTRTGYSFNGWNEAADGSGNNYMVSNTFSIAATTTLYAKWVSAYEGWSAGVVFDGDANGDGVKNGMAWLLGAADKNSNASSRLPVASQSGSGIVLNFTCLKVANRGAAIFKLQFSDDLGDTDPWANHEAEVPDTSGTINSISFVTSANVNPDLIDVQVTVPSGSGGKRFVRLMGE